MNSKFSPFSQLIFYFFFLLFLFFSGPIFPEEDKSSKIQSVAPATVSLSKEQVNEKLMEVQNQIKEIPIDAADDSPGGKLRIALQRRNIFLQEYLNLLARADEQDTQRRGLEQRIQQANKKLTPLSADVVTQIPPSPTIEEFEKLNEQVNQQRNLVISIKTTISENSKLAEEELTQLLVDAQTRIEEAKKRTEKFVQKAAIASGESEKKLFEIRIENGRYDEQIALKTIEVVQKGASLAKELEPVLTKELEIEEKQLERLEQQLAVYSLALEQQLASEKGQKEEELVRKEQEVLTAETAEARFLATWEADLARSQKNIGALEAFDIGLQKEQSEQEKRLNAEKEELIVLHDYLNRSGVLGKAGDRIKVTSKQLKLRRRILNRPIRQNFDETLNQYRDRRFEIEDILFNLKERWKEEVDALLSELSQSEKVLFQTKATDLLNQYRSALRDEKNLLTEIISLGQKIQDIQIQRIVNLEETERFIRIRSFWLRDGKPLSLEILKPIGNEILILVNWLHQTITEESIPIIKTNFQSPTMAIYTLFLVVILPILLFLLRQRFRNYVRKQNQMTLDEGARIGLRMAAILYGLLGAILLPAYLMIFSQFVQSLLLPNQLNLILSEMLSHIAYFLFFWFVCRSIFAGRSIAQVQFGMPQNVAHSLYASLRLILFGYVSWLLLWRILRNPPFEFEACPRILYTLFEITVVVSIAWLVKAKSPFVQHVLESFQSTFLKRNWIMIQLSIIALSIGIVALDVTGFRYAARSLTNSLILTFLTLIILPSFYTAIQSAVQKVIHYRKRISVSESMKEEEKTSHIEKNLYRFIRVLFILIGVFLIAGFWGLDEQILKTLDEIKIYGVRGAEDIIEYITAADIFRFIFYIAITFWMLKNLPGIYEVTIFPRIRVDEGIKYAILTISRYTIFTIGIILALSEIHLDLSRLSWLMAAIGVGLGFGLQEIVSNFVSGIILLIERPVQVGDTVTVGGMSGTVKRINIRATTILNFDRREVVLPNRSLITSEVTNWTRGDTIQRLVISIGVAYGSDVNQVSELLLRIAKDQPEILSDPESSVIFMKHGESSLDFDLRVFIPSPSVMFVLRDRLNKQINQEFAKYGIEIPFPQRDLHIKSYPQKNTDSGEHRFPASDL